MALLSPCAIARGQELDWRPARPSTAIERAQEQVASRRPGRQPNANSSEKVTSPPGKETQDKETQGSAVAAAQFNESFEGLTFADGPEEVELSEDELRSGDLNSLPVFEEPALNVDSPLMADSPLFNDGGSFCDCPECTASTSGVSGTLYNWLGNVNGCGWWVTTDYLLWSFDGMDLPALVTTSPNGTAAANTGVLGLSSTSTLFGGTVGDDFRSGGRISIGMWLDPHRQWSWEGSYLGFESDAQQPRFHSSNTANLARPVFDTLTGNETAVLVAQSNFLTGGTVIDASTKLQAFEVIRRQPWLSDEIYHVDFLIGYKHGDLDEFLRLDDSSTYRTAQGPILAGTSITRFDQFDVENSFDGLVLGLDRRHRWRGWMIGYTGKISLGANQSRVRIDGQTSTTVPNGGGTSIATGGLLAQTSNIGDFRRDDFAVIPEFEFLVRRQVTDRVRLHAGYSLLYWSGATRVGDTVSRRVSQFPPEPVSGTRDPKFTWTDNGFFAHGFQFGMDYRF